MSCEEQGGSKGNSQERLIQETKEGVFYLSGGTKGRTDEDTVKFSCFVAETTRVSRRPATRKGERGRIGFVQRAVKI